MSAAWWCEKFDLSSCPHLGHSPPSTCMMTLWHPAGHEPTVAPRLKTRGIAVIPWPGNRIPDLQAGSADAVCVIPETAFRGSGWAALRVQLSRSGRFFIVELGRTETLAVVAAMRAGAFDVLTRDEARWETAIA